MKDISLKELIDIINKETLTQKEVAKKMKKSVRWIKYLTAVKKLVPYRLKSNVLYDKKL